MSGVCTTVSMCLCIYKSAIFYASFYFYFIFIDKKFKICILGVDKQISVFGILNVLMSEYKLI